jgi:hypothetical protein
MMKTLLKIAVLAATLASTTIPAIAQTTVERTYTDGSYMLTCILEGGAEYCGNWNVVTPVH